ncbi:MAG: phosphate ABC transporter permease PstA [Candidatus Omnitrophica bacterium]|nr:phosphate ABC transporter permease PstA [Candidatus Omnitrophota bacterium]MCM8801784.1 phosphate ABC transporter permease PstA [Candidatus Omnitrophota bacterium]
MKIFKDRIFKFLIIIFTIISILPLFFIFFIILKKGLSVINLNFLLSLPKPPGETGGGILNAIVGTFLLIFIASLISIPLGIFLGIFLYEYKKRKIGEICYIFIDVLQGIPSIVIGIVAYIWIVKKMGHFSAFSGGFALFLILLPIVIKSTKETLDMIPFDLIETSLSLGITYPRTILKVVLPCGMSGMMSGILVGIGRISGETAPLLFTAFGSPFLNLNILKPISSLPHLIFTYTMSPYDDWHRQAWGCALLLIMIILSLNIISKIIVKKWKIEF